MAQTVRLWIETTYHVAFRYGGWAYAREDGGALAGFAGGERSTTAGRIDLAVLIAALGGVSAAADVAIHTATPSLLQAARLLASPPPPGSDAAPAEDLDLWAQALTAAKGRKLSVVATVRARMTPADFLFAWAEVGQDKAKGAGRFAAAIPKSNLAKFKP